VEEDVIRGMTTLLVSSLVRGDAGSAASVYADDATLLAPTADLIHGQAEIERYWRAGIALGISSVEFESEVLETVGERVVDVGRYTVSVGAAQSEAGVDRGIYVVLHLRRADGSWRRVVDVFSPDEPANGSSSRSQGGVT
jgi:ketosteroid isomerase-like protein